MRGFGRQSKQMCAAVAVGPVRGSLNCLLSSKTGTRLARLLLISMNIGKLELYQVASFKAAFRLFSKNKELNEQYEYTNTVAGRGT